MARSKTAKKPTKKKADTSDEGDPLDDLEDEINEDLDEEFDPDDLDGEDDEEEEEDEEEAEAEEEAETEEASKLAKSLVGKTVDWTSEEDDKVRGKVIEAGTGEGDEFDPNGVIIEDSENLWEADANECKLVKAPSKKKATTKKAPAKKAASKKKTTTEAAPAKTAPAKGGKRKKGEPRERRMVLIKDIKVPKSKVRDVDPDSPGYKIMFADVRKRGQQQAAIVDSFDKLTLVDGLRRLTILEAQGKTHIEVQEATKVDDADSRLYHGLMDNEARERMTWVEIARVAAKLAQGKTYTQRQIARGLGMTDGQMSRMIAAVSPKGLPKKLLAIAESGNDSTDEKAQNYSMSTYFELANADKKIVAEATALMEEGKPLTVTDVRAMKKADKKAKAAKGEDVKEEKRGGKRESSEPTAHTYRNLSSNDLGDYIKAKVTADEVVLTIHIDWSKKSFKGFDPVDQIRQMFEAVYGDEEVSLDSNEAFAKALYQAKKGLG